jgi:hypothetical protein
MKLIYSIQRGTNAEFIAPAKLSTDGRRVKRDTEMWAGGIYMRWIEEPDRVDDKSVLVIVKTEAQRHRKASHRSPAALHLGFRLPEKMIYRM